MALLYNFIIKAMDAIDSVRDPEKFATKLQLYATLDDPKFLSLVARIESVCMSVPLVVGMGSKGWRMGCLSPLQPKGLEMCMI